MSLVSDLKKKGVDPAVNVSAYRVDTTPKSTNSNSASKSSGSKLVQDLQGSGVRPAVEIYKEEEERRAKEYAQRVKDTTAQNDWAEQSDNRTTLQKGIDKLLGVDRTKVTGEKTDWGELAKGAVVKGANQTNASFWSGVSIFNDIGKRITNSKIGNWLFGDLADSANAIATTTINGAIDTINSIFGTNYGGIKNGQSALDYLISDSQAGKANAEAKYEANANSSRAAQIVDQFGTSTVAAIPMAIEAAILAPTQAAQAAQITTSGLSYFSGLQSAKGTEAVGMMAREGLNKLFKNPQFWTSYLQAAGDGYESAKEDGMSQDDAAVYALTNGFFNAMVEVGGADEALGGIQNLPMRLRQAAESGNKAAVVDWFKDSVLGEAWEEVQQGVLERGIKSFFGQDVPLWSTDPTDDRAIFNPYTAGQEFLGGAVVGGVLGGGQVAAQSAIQSVSDSRTFKGDANALIKAAKNSAQAADQARIAEIESAVSTRKNNAMTVGEARVLQEIASRTGNMHTYVQNIIESEKQQRAAAQKENQQRQRVVQVAKGLAADAEGAGAKVDIANLTMDYDGRTAKVDLVRSDNQNKVRLRFDDGSEKILTIAEAEAAGLDNGAKSLMSWLSQVLGQNGAAAYSVYDGEQEVGKYATAMNEAINLYAGMGVDVRQAAKAAKESGSNALIATLNDAQLELAQSLGSKIYNEKQANIKETAGKYQQIRQQAQEAANNQDPSVTKAMGEVNAGLADARAFLKEVQRSYNQMLDTLQDLEDSGMKDSEAYQTALEVANRLKSQIDGTQKAIDLLTEERKSLQAKQPIKRKKGTVSFAGGTIEGQQVKGVDQSKLTRQQKNVVAMVEKLADAVNIDYVFFDGDPKGSQGAYISGGTVYININAGMAANKALAAATLSHELTHYMQEFAPAEYEELKQFIIQEVVGQGKFEALVQQQQRLEPNLSYDKAMDEVVANACQTMLLDSKAIAELARQNMTLAEKIADFIEDFTQKIKDAFEEVNPEDNLPLYNALKAMSGQLEQMQQLWDAGIKAATENYNATQQTGEQATEEAMPAAAQKTQFMLQPDPDLVEKNLSGGKKAVDELIDQAQNAEDPSSLVIKDAMYRSDIGPIDFRWGNPGKGEKFKKGGGLSHIIAKHGKDTAYKAVDVIANATSTDVQTNSQADKESHRRRLYYDGYTVVLSKDKGSSHWLLTAWENNETASPNASGEVRDSSGATAAEPIRTRLNGAGNAVSDEIIPESQAESKAKIDQLDDMTPAQKQTFYQQWDEAHDDWAPVFFSKMENAISEWTGGNGQKLPPKMSAGSVVSWLKGKGVKDEEIKWSGIVPYLEGKKSVTQEELQAVMSSNETPIHTKILEDTKLPEFISEVPSTGAYMEFADYNEAYEFARRIATRKGLNPDQVRFEDNKFYVFDPEAFDTQVVLEVEQPDVWDEETGDKLGKGTHWKRYTLPGGKNYREILFQIPGMKYENRASRLHWRDDAPGTIVHARVQDMLDEHGVPVLFVEEVQSDLHNAGVESGFATQEQLNQYEALTRDARQKGRSRPTLVNQLYYDIEKLMRSNPDIFGRSPYTSLGAIEMWIDGEFASPTDNFDDNYTTPEMQQKQGELVNAMLTNKQRQQIEEIRKAEKTLKEFTDKNKGTNFYDAAPDVPYAGSDDSYNGFVMKHMLRMAAEGGYGAVGWTTGEQQAERWKSGDEELDAKNKKAYVTNYDMKIPKFMRKYGKQWDATVEGINLENGQEVWGMYVDGDMANSVLREGQAKFQQWDDLSDNEQQAEINASMTMDQARTMIQKAFVAGGIKEWYDGAYKNGDEWIKAEGIDEVAMYIENEYEIARKYLYSNEHINNDDYSVYDILRAYLAGTLTGKAKAQLPRVDVSKGSGYQDNRFYAPGQGSATQETWDLANTRATKSNQNAVNKARKDILMAAHNGDITKALGITTAELNKKLRQWSRYSAQAREASMRINANVAPENQWTGIQNSSILSGMNISDEDIRSMVGSVNGKSSEYQRRYIGNTMLALDTHINWSWLNFDFKSGYVNQERKSVRGLYEDSKKLVTIGGGTYQNTVSHEMGHALDYQWQRDLFGESRGGNGLSRNSWVESLIRDDDGRTFYRNFHAFINELQDVNENYNSYTMEPSEIFARFVARFVEWTQNIAGAYTFNESLSYNDRFTTKNYLDFARLLQEKAALDSKWAMEDGQTQFQQWEGQISLDEWMNGGVKVDDSLHPRIRSMLDKAAATEQKVKDYFSQIPQDSEYYLDPEEIDDMMEMNPYGSAYDGYMNNAEQILQNLSDLSKTQYGQDKEQTYELMDELLGYMSTLRSSYWKEEHISKNQTFTEWYNRKHPSLYYPGYTPGSFNYRKEKNYLEKMIRDGSFTGEDLQDAQMLLDEMNAPNTGTWYQKWDDIDIEDFASETEERKESYTRIQAEDVTLAEAIQGLNAAIEKQKTTIGKIQDRLKLGRTKEARESDARKLAKHLITKHNSVADVDRVAAELKALGDYILQSKKVDQDELKQRARLIASEIIQNAEVEAEVSGELETYQDIVNDIKGKKLTIWKDDIGELGEGEYNNFRKANFGNFTLAKREKPGDTREGYKTVNEVYAGLQQDHGKYYFPDINKDGNNMTEGDKIKLMASYFDLAKPDIVNPYQSFLGEAIEETANGIVADALDGILRPVSTEATTKQQAKELGEQIAAGEQGAVNLIAAAQKIAEAYETADSRIEALKLTIDLLKKQENKANQKELEALRETVYDLTIALDKAESHYRTLQRSAEARMTQIKEEGRARQAQIKAEEKAKANAAAKKHYQDLAQRAKERRKENAGATKYRAKIQAQAKKLSEWLLKNSDKEHIPEALKAPLLEFLTSIDFTSKRALNGGTMTQNDMKFGARLQKLQQMLQNQQSYIDGNGEVQADLGGYIDISPDMMQFLRDTAQKVTNDMASGNYYTINRMTAAELRDLSNLLAALTKSIRNMNSLMANERYATVREAASQDIDQMESLGKAPDSEGSRTSKFLKWKNSVPYYAMKRFGQGAQSVFSGLTKGWEKLAYHAQEIIDFTEKAYTDKEVNEWKKEIHNIELSDGSQIRMTTAQLMEFAMLYNREQAQKHLKKGGLRIGNIEYKKGTITDVTHYHLNEADINKLFDLLTDRQLQVAYALQKFMANKGAEWGNEISMRRFGYNFYTEGENYYPIKTDANDRPMADTDAQQNSMFRLLNLSSSKSLNPKASNALVVGDIFDTFADHMSDQAKLNALGLPILDAIKWFNFKERIDKPDGTYNTRTLQAAMEQAFGAEAQHYFRTLMKDINGVTESGDRGTEIASKMMSNYKIASVGGNLRVALLQPTAYVRAQTVLSRRNLLRAFAYKNGINEALENSGTAVWKDLGYYDTNISRNMRQQIQHDETRKDKIQEASMWLAEKMDKVTWGRLWIACKLQAQDMNPNLEGEALMQRTADLFREVVYSSQVMDSTLTRSELMRGNTKATKALTAFMAEPTLSYNILLDAYSQYELDTKKHGKQGAWQRNQKKLENAFVVYISSAVVTAIAESVMDAVRDDDDYESFLEKFLQAMFGEGEGLKRVLDGNLMQDLLVSSKIPYAKDVVNRLIGFGSSSDMSTEGITTILNAFAIWRETIQLNGGLPDWIEWADPFGVFEPIEKPTKTTYYGKMMPWGKIYKSLQGLSQLSGLPVSGALRDVIAMFNTTVGSMVPYWKIKTYDSGTKSNIFRAMDDGAIDYNEAKELLVSEGVYENEDEAEKALTKHGSQMPEITLLLQYIGNGNEKAAQKALEALNNMNYSPNKRMFSVRNGVEEMYADGDLSYEKAMTALVNYAGMSTSDAGKRLKYAKLLNEHFSEINTSGDNSLQQKELGEYLKQEEKAGRMSHSEAVSIWEGHNVGEQTNLWKTTYDEWLKKNK